MMCSVEIGKQKQIHFGQKELTRLLSHEKNIYSSCQFTTPTCSTSSERLGNHALCEKRKSRRIL
jgi:hypothetical protein